jgi:hypothetical protein
MKQLSMTELWGPTPDVIRAHREAADLTQAAAAKLVFLRDKARWSEYERGVEQIDLARWELFLLLTGQHPRYEPLQAKATSAESAHAPRRAAAASRRARRLATLFVIDRRG